MPETLKVLIASADEDAIRLLQVILQREVSISLVGHARTGKELSVMKLGLLPHVVLLDLDAPGEEMLAAVRTIKSQGNQTGFVGLVGDSGVDQTLLGEVDALFYKNAALNVLSETLHEIGGKIAQKPAVDSVTFPHQQHQGAEELQRASRRLEEVLRAVESAYQTWTEADAGPPQDDAAAEEVDPPAVGHDKAPPERPANALETGTAEPSPTHPNQEALTAIHNVEADGQNSPTHDLSLRSTELTVQLNSDGRHLPTELGESRRGGYALAGLRDVYSALFDELPAPAWRSGVDGKYCHFNKNWLAFTGRTIGQETDDGWTHGIHPEDLNRRADAYSSAFNSRQPFEIEFRLRRHDGEFRWIIDIGRPFQDLDGNFAGYIGLCYDVTERRQNEQQLSYMASHDSLTGLANRRMLEETLSRVLARARRGTSSVLLFLDVDNFKLVNDILGHAAGDRALVTLTQLLQNQLRTEDLLVRLGGDEFVALLEGATVEEAQVVAERARRAVEEFRFILDGQTFKLSLSIGIVEVDGRHTSAILLSQADAAMYKAKEQGRNRIMLYRPDEDSLVFLPESNQLVALLKDAFRKGLFALHFQPIVRLSDGQVDHYEALVRLRAETGRIVPPAEFIPAAERFGLMPQLTRWIVQEVIRTLHEYSGIRLSANLSSMDLTDEALPEFIEARLRGHKVEPARLGFEIAELAIRKNLSLADGWIRRLKALGCRFALDDFGAGFVSFAYLRSLPVDQFKIDGAFVRAVENDPSQLTIVQAVHALARIQGKETIAEWVENAAIARILKDIGIPYGQGYYLGDTCPDLAPHSPGASR
ncbi:MAG: EAL domain-containing protein [Chloroflexi bacterium]|nr:EAL domain-containing protein [Chloroflexota bacterium]